MRRKPDAFAAAYRGRIDMQNYRAFSRVEREPAMLNRVRYARILRLRPMPRPAVR